MTPLPRCDSLRPIILILTVVFAFGTYDSGQAQPAAALVSLDVTAGFDGAYRDGQWLPVEIRMDNGGGDVRGRLTIRPQTSGPGINHTYSTTVDLPAGAQQTARLYITAAGIAQQVRVELLDDAGFVIASAPAPLRPIQPQDRLLAVITNAIRGSVDITAIKTGLGSAYQANLAIDDLPEQVGLFDSVDLLLVSDADTGSLTTRQRDMLADWVASGGHLIVTGGPNWQATASGLAALLPIVPASAAAFDDLAPIARWLRSPDPLRGQSIVAIGNLQDGAAVLAAAEDGTPLIARRRIGQGAVDYLAVDPGTMPLRGWDGLPELWYMLASTVDPLPSWSHGFIRWNAAAAASEILPGFDRLPDVVPLFVFLLVYILLIGPINYLVLSRLRRRELAWVSIPILIAVFSGLAYLFGSNLRGNEATLSRLTLVRTWPDRPQARADTVVGLLSPRRSEYDLAIMDASLRPLPLPRAIGSGLLSVSTQAAIEISETDTFSAQNFTVDASFLGQFTASAAIPRPDIAGQVTIIDDDEIEGQQRLRGAVSNDSELTLNEPIILARGVAFRLGTPLAPGDLVDFDLTLPPDSLPAPLLFTPSALIGPANTSAAARLALEQTVIDLLGDRRFNPNLDSPFIDTSEAGLENRRRQLFLSSFARDAYGASGRGSGVFLAGWTDASPLESRLDGAAWRATDTTLYLIELQSLRATPNTSVLIGSDQFNWVIRSFTGLGDVSPFDLRLDQNEELVFQFAPLASATVRQVQALYLVLQNISSGSRRIPVELWHWSQREWVEIEVSGERFEVPDHARFIGPQNAVQIRLRAQDLGGFLRVGRIGIEQRGLLPS